MRLVKCAAESHSPGSRQRIDDRDRRSCRKQRELSLLSSLTLAQLCARRTGLPSDIMSRRRRRNDILPLMITQHPLLTTDKYLQTTRAVLLVVAHTRGRGLRRIGLPSHIMSRRRWRNDILPLLMITQHPLLTTDKSAFSPLYKIALQSTPGWRAI
jgi:hypothetical protein